MHPLGLAVRLALVGLFLSALGVIVLLPRRRRAASWAVVIAAFVVPFLSFSHADWRHVSWIPFSPGPLKPLDIVGNTLLYLPFGFFFHDAADGHASAMQCAGFAAILSCATELTQIFGPGRFPSATDVTMNVAGALIGFIYSQRRAAIRILSAERRYFSRRTKFSD